ncbi:MAG: glutathione peroxidase [Peptostreptococcaceae bacterium]
MNFYSFKAKKINGQEISMKEYEGKVIVVVNTASKCGLTSQLEDLERLYKKYKDEGFEILGFPCNQFANQESGSNGEIKEFCKINYGVSFTMFEKIDVNGENAHPLYKYLKNQTKGILGKDIKWNFTKFIIDRKGNVIKRFAPISKIDKIEEDIKEII